MKYTPQKILLKLLTIFIINGYAVAVPNIQALSSNNTTDLLVYFDMNDIGQTQIQCKVETTITDGINYSTTALPIYQTINNTTPLNTSQGAISYFCKHANACTIIEKYNDCIDLNATQHYIVANTFDNMIIKPLYKDLVTQLYKYSNGTLSTKITLLGAPNKPVGG